MGLFEANAKYPDAQDYYYVEFPDTLCGMPRTGLGHLARGLTPQLVASTLQTLQLGKRFYLHSAHVVKGATSLSPKDL